jgi:cell cycle serine/threonine-protein kinase CDC5/MSD2
LIGKPPFQTSDVKSIYERIKKNNYEFPPNKPISPDGQALITDILTHDPKKRPTLHQIIDHDFFIRGIFPPSIPISAHEYPPTFSSVTRQQSKANYARVRRATLLDAEDTEIRTVDIVDSGSQLDAATAQQQQKQEREFHKAVQPGSPISVLLRSAREPLLVSKSPLRVSHHASENRPPPPPPTNALLRKLSAAAPKSSASLLSAGSTPFPALPTLDDQDVAPSTATTTAERYHHRRPRSATATGTGMPPPPKKDANANSSIRPPLQALPTLQEEQNEARRQYDLASQKARIVSQMAGVDEDGEGNRRNARGKEREQRDRRDHSQHVVIPFGKGLAEDETESIKPIRETPRKLGKAKADANGRLSSQ